MNRTIIEYISIPLAFLILTTTAFAQVGQQNILQDMRESASGTGASAGRISLDESLRKELRSKQQQIREMSEYIPMEGSVDPDTYIVGPGDQFLVGFAGSVEEKYFVPVGADGFVILPYSHAVKVSDMTLGEAKASMRDALTEIYKEEDVSVMLASARLFIVHVTGMVKLPGSYVVTAADRVNSAIEMAGGPLKSAQLSDTRIIRGQDTLEIDLNAYKTTGDIESNPMLLDGDVIYVPGFDYSKPWVYLSGASYTDGPVNIHRGETAFEFITRVGATRDRLDLTEISLIREGEDYNINLLDTGKETTLVDGDSLFVSVLPDSVYVGGRVAQGGAVKYIAGLNPRAYVAMAGGLAKEGTMGKIKIYRDGEKLSINKAGQVRPGDAIIVGTDTFYWVIETAKALGQLGTLASAIYVIGFRD